MNRLILTNDDDVRVEYKVDALSSNFGRLTVYEVVGLTDAEEASGIQFRQLDYSLAAFKEFAEVNELKLIYLPSNGSEEVLIDALPE